MEKILTQKDLYEDAILRKSRGHKYRTKWVDKLDAVTIWGEVWASVHTYLHSNATKCAIREQLHLTRTTSGMAFQKSALFVKNPQMTYSTLS